MIYFATWPEWWERQGKRKWKCILGCKKTFIQVSICERVSCFRIKFNCICGGMGEVGGCVHILEGEVSVQIKGRRHIPRAPPGPWTFCTMCVTSSESWIKVQPGAFVQTWPIVPSHWKHKSCIECSSSVHCSTNIKLGSIACSSANPSIKYRSGRHSNGIW